ncbi:hypothetical protein M9458_056977, partial [Cirrhinus mrigala]
MGSHLRAQLPFELEKKRPINIDEWNLHAKPLRFLLPYSLLTTLDGGAVAVHLFLQNAATWRNHPHLPSKVCGPGCLCPACYGHSAGPPGQGAKKKLHKGSFDVGLMQGLHTATNFALPFGLFVDTFSAVQNQTDVIKHILTRRDPTKPSCAKPLSAHHRGCPPVASTPAPPTETLKEGTPQQGCQAGRKIAAQPLSQGPS